MANPRRMLQRGAIIDECVQALLCERINILPLFCLFHRISPAVDKTFSSHAFTKPGDGCESQRTATRMLISDSPMSAARNVWLVTSVYYAAPMSLVLVGIDGTGCQRATIRANVTGGSG